MPEPDRFCIIPVYADSTGSAAIPQNAVAHGSWSAITGRIRDSKQQRQLLTLINDAEHAKGTLQSIREREQAVAQREADVQAREDELNRLMLADAVRKLDATAARFDAFEAEMAKDPDDDELTFPPGMHDEGDLQSPKAAHEVLDPEPELPRLSAAMEDT
jgi:hypothetical protein